MLGLLLSTSLAAPQARAASVRAYVVDGSHDLVRVIDTRTDALLGTIPVAFSPTSIAGLPDGSRLYVPHRLNQTASVIDTASNTVVATVPVGYWARDIAALPDGSALYVTSYEWARVDVIDPSSDTVLDIIPVAARPWGVTALADSSRVYVVHPTSVSVIDTATRSVIATIPVEAFAQHAAAHPDGATVFVTHFGTQRADTGKLTVIDTASNSVVQVHPLPRNPVEAAVLPDGSRLYVARLGRDSVSVLDAATRQEIVEVPVGIRPQHLALTPDASRLYVTTYTGTTMLDTATNAVAAIIPGGDPANDVAIASFPACGDGELDAGEVCDDGNAVETDCCSSACVPAAPPGTPCDDGDVCNGVETTCDGAGTCQESAPALDCDDGALCTRDFCDPLTGCFHESGALLACQGGFARGSLLVKEDSSGNETLFAKLIKGPALVQTDFGNPLGLPSGTTAYAMCIYDQLGTLVESLDVDRAGEVCGPSGKRCWKAVGRPPPDGRGYVYGDSTASADGTRKLLLKGGDAGRSKLLFKAANRSSLGQTSLPTGIAAALAGDSSATIQLVSSDAECLTVTLDDVSKAEPDLFKARFDAP